MTLVVVSALDADAVQAAVEKAFAPVPRARAPAASAAVPAAFPAAFASVPAAAFAADRLPPPEAAWRSRGWPAFLAPAVAPFVVLAKPVAPLRALRLLWPLPRPDPDADLYPGTGGPAAAAAAAADLLAKPALVRRARKTPTKPGHSTYFGQHIAICTRGGLPVLFFFPFPIAARIYFWRNLLPEALFNLLFSGGFQLDGPRRPVFAAAASAGPRVGQRAQQRRGVRGVGHSEP
jgi:hypothetical protein